MPISLDPLCLESEILQIPTKNRRLLEVGQVARQPCLRLCLISGIRHFDNTADLIPNINDCMIIINNDIIYLLVDVCSLISILAFLKADFNALFFLVKFMRSIILSSNKNLSCRLEHTKKKRNRDSVNFLVLFFSRIFCSFGVSAAVFRCV